MLTPVFLPGERVNCLFEVVGEVTVQGPFPARDDVEAGSGGVVMQGVRLEVSRAVARSGADAVMLRELVYDRDAGLPGPTLPRSLRWKECSSALWIRPAYLPNKGGLSW